MSALPQPLEQVEPHHDMALRYLQLLDPAADWFSFQTFDDNKDRGDRRLARIQHLSDLTEELTHLQARGAGIFVTVNETDGKGRSDKNIVRVRAVWQEDDDGFEGEFPLEPSLVVQTSDGKLHRYWLVADAWPTDEQGRADFAGVMRRMVADYGSDKSAKDLCRVLRVPGYWHLKGEPQLVQLVSGDGRRYPRAEIVAAFPPLAEPLPRAVLLPTPTNDQTERMHDALVSVPADDRDLWVKIGMALKAELGDAGFDMWREWSMRSIKFDEADTRAKWRSFKGEGISIRTLFKIARDHGWRDSHEGVVLKKGGKPLALEANNGSKRQSEPEKPKIDWHSGLLSASALVSMEFPPMVWIVPGILPEGLTLLGARPKLGKSWWALDLCIAAAGDTFFMGSIRLAVHDVDVLYLALEDNPRRLKKRLTKLLQNAAAPPRLSFHTQWPRVGQGGLESLREWLIEHPSAKLIVVDTLAKFRPATNKEGYTADHDAVAGLQQLAGEFGVAILVIHHDRKAPADDPFDTLSGTLGLTGGVDGMLVLKREVTGVTTLYGRGRDMEEIEKAVEFNKVSCSWRLLGDAEEQRQSKQRRAVLRVLEEAKEPLGPKAIADEVGAKVNNIKQLLRKMLLTGDVEKKERGYTLPQQKEE